MTTPIFARLKITNEVAIAFIGLYAMAVVMGFGRFLFTATLPDIISQLDLSTQTAGALASVNYIGYFFGALIAMFVPQRLTWQSLMFWALASIITTSLLAMPNLALWAWYLIRAIAGVASGVAMILSSSLVLGYLSAPRRSVLSSVHYAGIGAGISASAVLTWTLLSLDYHFDTIWLTAALISLPVILLLIAIRPQVSPKATTKLSIYNTYVNFKRALYEAISGHGKIVALLCLSYALEGFGYITSATFLPVMATHRLPEQTSVGLIIWLIVGLFAMLSNPLWGALAKRIGETQTLIGLTLLQAIGMLFPIVFPATFGLYGNAVILGLTFAGIVSMTLVLIKNINPLYSNLLMGVATLAYSVGQFLGPLITVWLAGNSDNFNLGLMVAAACLVISLLLVIWFYRQTKPITA